MPFAILAVHLFSSLPFIVSHLWLSHSRTFFAFELVSFSSEVENSEEEMCAGSREKYIEFVELRRREEGDLSLLLLLLLRNCKNSHLTVKEMNGLGIRYGNPLHTTVDVSELLFEMKVMKRNWRSAGLEQIRFSSMPFTLLFFLKKLLLTIN